MNKGKIQILIENKIKKNFPDSFFELVNDSKKHSKHKQSPPGLETHFILTLKSNKFSQLSRLERQKYLIEILGNEIIDKIHSISFKLISPSEESN